MQAKSTFAEFQRVHRKWTDRDAFRTVPKEGDSLPGSIRQFIHDMSLGNLILREVGQSARAKFPDLTDLHKTFGEFVGESVREQGGDLISIRSLVCEAFCTSLISDLAAQVTVTCRDDHVKNAAFNELGVKDWSGWMTSVNQEEVAQTLALALLDDLLARLKDRTLYSFFVRGADQHGFINWGADMKSDAGHPLKPHCIEDMGRTVVVNVRRYDERDDDETITAYEWNAELSGGGTAAPDAVACGMVYVFERNHGAPIGDRSALLEVADSVADTDLLQVSAFFAQHDDAQRIIEESDLCFVWQWERRSGTERGLGARCLKAAVLDLQNRFNQVRTVVIDTRPAQFVSWNMHNDPPMVQVAKQTAIEQLVGYVQQISLPNVQVRHIFNRLEDDPLAALVILATDDIERMGRQDGRATEVRLTFDWSDHAEELASLFQRAGLDDLSCAVEEGYASCYEVAQALKHLIFHQRIPFLPASISAGIDFDELLHTVGVPPQEAMVEPDVDYFISTLPAGVTFRQAHWQEMTDDGIPGWIILVTATTKFCELSEYFTLIPVPRPMDVSFLIDTRAGGKFPPS